MANQVSLWEPFKDFVTLREAMDNLFEESFVPSRRRRATERQGGERGPVYRMPVDAYANEEYVFIKAYVPGVTSDEVEITIDGDTLTLQAERQADIPEGAEAFILEGAVGTLQRSLTLNVPIDSDKAEAEVKDGILNLKIPKAEAAKPKKITVKS